MNGFSSECSSGCESGWTMYLDHSASPNSSQINDENGFFYKECKAKQYQEEEDDEEGLSMVSDASSGPPHCHEDEEFFDENGCFSPASLAAALAKNTNKRQKIKQPTRKKQQHSHSLLDDTASSPIFNFSNGNINLTKQQGSRNKAFDFSQGFSATPYNELYAFQNQPQLLQSSLPGKPTSAKQVSCRNETGNRI